MGEWKPPRDLRPLVTDMTGVNHPPALDELIKAMHDLTPASAITRMNRAQFGDLVHSATGLWADRGWPGATGANPET
jgi:hypothetical protein